MKTETCIANSILQSSEYFCQISSKSIPIILSYTVTKLVHFFKTQCITLLLYEQLANMIRMLS